MEQERDGSGKKEDLTNQECAKQKQDRKKVKIDQKKMKPKQIKKTS